jgi:antitoxin MazE
MRQELIRIGNSRGIRIPKPLIAQCGLGDVVELRLTREGLIVAPYRAPRYGWKDAFARSDLSNQTLLLERVATNAFDKDEWNW